MVERAGSRWGFAFVVAVTACGGVSIDPSRSDPSAGSGASAGSSSYNAGGVWVGPTSPVGGGPGVGGTPVGEGGESPGVAGSAPVSRPSSGCGEPLPATQVPTIPGSRTGYTEWNVDVTGETLVESKPEVAGTRQFFVRVPADYDPEKPYRVVYVTSGCGAQRAGKTNTYALFDEVQGGDEQAVYVAVSLPDNATTPGCYDNTPGPQSQEWEAFEAIHALVESNYCVDNDRIYVAGYSSGSTLAAQWGCYFGGAPSARKFAPEFAIRGTLGVAGTLPPDQPLPCNGPAAHLWIHDYLDKSNLIEAQAAALDLALKTNACTGNYVDGPKRAWGPGELIPTLAGGLCQEYTGCPADVAARYPIVFCTTSGFGHADQSERAIPAFASFLDYVDQPK